MPKGESLKMTRARVEPFWQQEMMKTLRKLGKGKTLLFTAHEHIFRGMVQSLTGIDNQEILSLRIPNAAPFVFEFDVNQNPIKNYYIEDHDVPVTKSTKKESKETILDLEGEQQSDQNPESKLIFA